MDALVKNMKEKDYYQVKEAIHKLKASAGYAGASHLHYVCYFMHDLYNND